MITSAPCRERGDDGSAPRYALAETRRVPERRDRLAGLRHVYPPRATRSSTSSPVIAATRQAAKAERPRAARTPPRRPEGLAAPMFVMTRTPRGARRPAARPACVPAAADRSRPTDRPRAPAAPARSCARPGTRTRDSRVARARPAPRPARSDRRSSRRRIRCGCVFTAGTPRRGRPPSSSRARPRTGTSTVKR